MKMMTMIVMSMDDDVKQMEVVSTTTYMLVPFCRAVWIPLGGPARNRNVYIFIHVTCTHTAQHELYQYLLHIHTGRHLPISSLPLPPTSIRAQTATPVFPRYLCRPKTDEKPPTTHQSSSTKPINRIWADVRSAGWRIAVGRRAELR
jgi:hypothetical protein